MDVIEIGLENQELVNMLFDGYRVFYGRESDVRAGATFITERLVRQETVIFVAMIGEEPVGFVQLYPKFSSARLQKDWVLNDLYVVKRFRRQGLGEALINSSLTFAKEAGASFIQLSTAFDNYIAILSQLFSPTTYTFKQIIEANLFSQLTVEELAQQTNLSISSFKREFAKLYNDTPANYIKNKKLEKAAELLLVSKERISDIAFNCGFNDLANFTKSFSEKYRTSPTSYRLNQITK